MLLRREFQAWRDWKREVPPVGRKILVATGGGDPDDLSNKIIHALGELGTKDLDLTVAAGPMHPQPERLAAESRKLELSGRIAYDSADIPDLMAKSDLVIIPAGGTLWESLYMGCSIVSYSRNAVQASVISELADRNLIIDQGSLQDFDPRTLAESILECALSLETRQRSAREGRRLIDGRGAERTVQALFDAAWPVRS